MTTWKRLAVVGIVIFLPLSLPTVTPVPAPYSREFFFFNSLE